MGAGGESNEGGDTDPLREGSSPDHRALVQLKKRCESHFAALVDNMEQLGFLYDCEEIIKGKKILKVRMDSIDDL